MYLHVYIAFPSEDAIENGVKFTLYKKGTLLILLLALYDLILSLRRLLHLSKFIYTCLLLFLYVFYRHNAKMITVNLQRWQNIIDKTDEVYRVIFKYLLIQRT